MKMTKTTQPCPFLGVGKCGIIICNVKTIFILSNWLGKNEIMKNNFTNRITRIILDNCNVEEAKRPINVKGLSLSDDLEYDSICFMNMIVDLESELGISFDDTELLLDNLDDCTKLIEYIIKLIEEKKKNGGMLSHE